MALMALSTAMLSGATGEKRLVSGLRIGLAGPGRVGFQIDGGFRHGGSAFDQRVQIVLAEDTAALNVDVRTVHGPTVELVLHASGPKLDSVVRKPI
jgi:hypothetical protein